MLLAIAAFSARVILAVVFAVAAAGKVTDRSGAQDMLTAFGAPKAVAAPGWVLLTAAEFLIAVSLLTPALDPAGDAAALGLLLVFTAAVGFNLALGRRPQCNCFGQVAAKPIGVDTLARNVVLSLLAALLVWRDRSISDSLDFTSSLAPVLVSGCVVATASCMTWMRSQNRQIAELRTLLLQRSNAAPVAAGATSPAKGLPVGMAAPDFSLSDIDGASVTLSELRASGRSIILFFSNPNCVACHKMLPDLQAWRKQHHGRLQIVSIVAGPGKLKERTEGVLFDTDRKVSNAYSVWGTPTAVLVRPDGTIGSRLAMGPKPIQALVETSATLPVSDTDSPADPSRLTIGQPAPDFQGSTRAGDRLSLKSLLGQKVLLIFLGVGCGYSEALARDLKRLIPGKRADAPKLLIVITGEDPSGWEPDLEGLIVEDADGDVFSAYGLRGTPAALLIDEQGAVCSGYIPGSIQVMEFFEVLST